MVMRIIIDISEDSYKATCNGYMTPPDVENVVSGIKNGTPLPEGHGRLIDADALTEKAPEIQEYLDVLAPTIIEADKESE